MNYNNSHHFGHCQTASMQDGCSLSDLVGFSVMEKWKDIKGYEGYYKVSDLGRVKRLERIIKHPMHGTCLKKSGFLKAHLNKTGYKALQLCKNGISKLYLVHRLIAFSFIPNPENKATVNHINGIKTDNSLDNLEWATYSENNKHAYDNGLTTCRKRNYSEDQVHEMKRLRKSGLSYTKLADRFNGNSGHIWRILNTELYVSYKN